MEDLAESTEKVTAHLLESASWGASRSSGPGGQRRDKVATRAELTITLEAVEGLDPAIAARLVRQLGLDRADLRLTSQEDRMLARNRELLEQRLRDLVEAALRPPPRARRATRPSRAAVAEREASKRQRGEVKRLRRPPDPG